MTGRHTPKATLKQRPLEKACCVGIYDRQWQNVNKRDLFLFYVAWREFEFTLTDYFFFSPVNLNLSSQFFKKLKKIFDIDYLEISKPTLKQLISFILTNNFSLVKYVC